MWWTFNMLTDHAEVTLTDVRVDDAMILGREGEGLDLAQHLVHENRIRADKRNRRAFEVR